MRNSPREKAGRRRGTYGTYKRETWLSGAEMELGAKVRRNFGELAGRATFSGNLFQSGANE